MRKGVVHVGAHRGEEVADYLADGRSPIILFEPQELGWEPPVGVILCRTALGSSRGSLTMYVPHHLHDTLERDTQSTSGLRLIPEMARKIGWTPTAKDEITVPVTRFRNWAAENKFSPISCSLLKIDVQGMELEVLQGFGSYLWGFDEAIIECSEKPLYEGGAPAYKVCKFMEYYGFTRSTPIMAHGDIIFTRIIVI